MFINLSFFYIKKPFLKKLIWILKEENRRELNDIIITYNFKNPTESHFSHYNKSLVHFLELLYHLLY